MKIGDKVRITDESLFNGRYHVGDEATVEGVGYNTISLKMSDGIPQYCDADDVEPMQSTVTITFNGDATTATDGERTATVTKYHDDEYSEETGAIEAIKKLYHHFPQKGDRYYLVITGGEGASVIRNTYHDGSIGKCYRKSGNFYETREAAQKVADKINAIFKEEH